SSADIFGPPQKWAVAEHIVMLDVVETGHRLEVFIEGKDMETRRFFLSVSPRGSGAEKFTYAGSVEEVAAARREVGDRNREAVLRVLQANDSARTTGEIVEALKATGIALGQDAVSRHAKALVKAGYALSTGKGPATRYFALAESPQAPSAESEGAENE
ncbi:MAG: winged helix-turn-helix domain-containing protein, partial [Nitrospinota bacterium]